MTKVPETIWAVIDPDSGGVVIAAGWPEACHEHINEAIADDIDGACRWVVRQYANSLNRAAHEPLTVDVAEKVKILRRHADIHRYAVRVEIEREALKEQADIFDGAADLIESLARAAPPPRTARSVTLTGYQLQEALDFIAPDRTPDELETEASIQYGPGHAGVAYYCGLAEYPEEGSIVLDERPAQAKLGVESK